MLTLLAPILPPAFGIFALLYLWLAVRVSRASHQNSRNSISFYLFLVGAMIAGCAFAFDTTDANLFGIGRLLVIFASGFLPVALYSIYREYTIGWRSPAILAVLSIIPVVSTLLAVTNPLHQMIWATVETEAGVRFTDVTEHLWFNRVHLPFAYAVFGYAIVAMAGRLPTIARAQRKKILLLVIGAALPYTASLTNTVMGDGLSLFTLTSIAMILMLPLYWWASVAARVFEFSPLAYQTMFDHVRDPIIVLDASQRIISANRPAQVLLKSSELELVGQRLWEDLPEARSVLDHARDRDLTQTIRLGTDRFFELNSAPLNGPTGEVQGTVVVCRDVTERKLALRALSDSEHLIRSLVEHSSNGILRFTLDGDNDNRKFRCTFANRAAERYLQTASGTLVGMPLSQLQQLEPEKLSQEFGGDSQPKSGISYETALESEDGEHWLRIIGEPVGSDFSVTLIDITQRKHNEDQMLADSLRDPLTGVLNRRGFEQEATASIAAHHQGAVLYLDLNHFKSVNDRFGHHAGDALLKAFGHRLGFCLRPEDMLARLGGDEFAIVLPGVSVEDAKHVAGRLVESASEAYNIQGQEIECTASVGIALMPLHGNELWHLVSVADQAMYNAKSISQEEAANDRAAYVEAAIAS